MSTVPGIKGMRHIALNVANIKRSKAFYQERFGMKVVWEPDPRNVYLSSGSDNIALHEVPNRGETAQASQRLDHFGFVIESIDRVRELEEDFRDKGVTIVHPFKTHRDGSASFYCVDPDGIVIQMLYEPLLSKQSFTESS
jgi:catechol 2,3-dioxygenase-like lactoylglutathione lyase family enzyme